MGHFNENTAKPVERDVDNIGKRKIPQKTAGDWIQDPEGRTTSSREAQEGGKLKNIWSIGSWKLVWRLRACDCLLNTKGVISRQSVRVR